ncbi:hypothetical protein FKP32DRAFT_1571247, partial [Trametes sanguinea]
SSKQLADQLAEFRLRIEKLKKLVNDNESDVEAMKEQMTHALADLETLDEVLCATGKRVSTVETNLAEMNERLNAMGERLDQALGGHLGADADTVKQRKGERNNGGRRGPRKERDNALHDAVRKCLYSMMGICPGGALPEPVALAGVHWEYIPSGPPDHPLAPQREEDSFLRPDWERPWKVNKKGWLLEVTQRIQRSGHKYTNALSREHLSELSHETIARAVKVVFQTMVKNWRMQSEDNGEDTKKARNLQAKISNRKRAKAKSRYEMRANVPEALDPKLAYQYQWQYQSTDESEVEDVPSAVKVSIDPETDDEATRKPLAAGNRLTRKVWVSRAPAWRLDEVNRVLDAIDVFVAKQRNEDKSGRGNTYRFRRRGEPRPASESQLPTLKHSRDAIRIPRRMVDAVWLSGRYGEPYDNRRYISEDEGEDQRDQEGEREEGGDEWELDHAGRGSPGLGSERAEEGVVENDHDGNENGQAREESVWEEERDVAENNVDAPGDQSDEDLEYLDR